MTTLDEQLEEIMQRRENLHREFDRIEQEREELRRKFENNKLKLNRIGNVLYMFVILLLLLVVMLMTLLIGPHSDVYVPKCDTIPTWEYRNVSDWADWVYDIKGYIRMTESEIKEYCE